MVNTIRPERIISGGQTGVDRAALDCAMALGIPHGGWCPAGRLAEDGIVDRCYGLEETPENDYTTRTRLNVRDSDGTLILARPPLEGGTALTANMARRLKKPCMVADPAGTDDQAEVIRWLEINNIRILNVAGPRASKQPDIYMQAYTYLESLLQ